MANFIFFFIHLSSSYTFKYRVGSRDKSESTLIPVKIVSLQDQRERIYLSPKLSLIPNLIEIPEKLILAGLTFLMPGPPGDISEMEILL